MKTLFVAFFALAAAIVPASAFTVTTPANGAQVISPFKLTASSTTCKSLPAVSMGYSIDSGPATIVSTSFNAMVSAPLGAHILHVKCWGNKVNDQVLLNITVVAGSASTSAITVAVPAKGAQLNSPFELMASATTCDSKPAVSMGYAIDSGSSTTVPTSFDAMVYAPLGAHVLHVKCWGKQVSDQVLMNITVVSISTKPPPAVATPVFSLPAGQYKTTQWVSLSDASAGAAIHYTTDGSAPTTSSPRYSAAIPISKSVVIQAVASSHGFANSRVARADYVIARSAPSIPSKAISEVGIHLLPNWGYHHDPGTSGSSDGSMTWVTDPTLSGQSAKFESSYDNWGGEIYSRDYATDPDAKNFLYDAHIWIDAGSQIANLELDNNQVIANGDTVIYAFQCAGTSNKWEYSSNVGTRSKPIVKWLNSSAPCDPADWTPNTWHHVQIGYSRDAVGNVTYQSVWLDGIESQINQTVPSAFALHWASGVLKTNFQVDGDGAGGSSTLYLDNLTIYRW